MATVEPPKGAYEKGKRGAIIYRNAHGTLESHSVKAGKGTFTGSCIVKGREHTRKMSGAKEDVRGRWERWQKQTIEAERLKEEREEQRRKGKAMQQNDAKLLDALALIAANLEKVNGTLSEIGLALLEQSEPEKPKTYEEGIAAFMSERQWFDFVNLTTDYVYDMYSSMMLAAGYPVAKQSTLTSSVKANYPELQCVESNGKRYFLAAK